MQPFIYALMFAHAMAAQIYVAEPTGVAEPTAEQRTALAAWAQSIWPGITPASVQEVRCERAENEIDGVLRQGGNCLAIETRTLSATDFAAAEASGAIVFLPSAADIAANGAQATVKYRWGPDFVYGSGATALAAVANAVWGIPAGQLDRMLIRFRAATPDAPEGSPDASDRYEMSAVRRRLVTSAERLACLRDGTCSARLE